MNTGNNFPEVFALDEQGQFLVYRNSYLAGRFWEENKKQNLKEISFSIIFLSLRAKYEFQHIEIGIFEDYWRPLPAFQVVKPVLT